LLIAAHGTRSTAGRATTRRVSDAVAAARTDLTVRLAYLDVARPSLQEMLTAASEPTVVVPLLLTAGYHVLTDIPAVTGASRRVRVAGHLGADELVIDALVDRLREVAGSRPARSTVLARVGSSRAEADADARVAVDLLARRLGRDVGELSLGSDVRAAVAALPAPVEVATYLLAEGEFFERARSAVDGLATMAAPLGAHPSVVELVLIRYDAAVTQWSQR
jgi:sirohydrochlorin ferrochelatase